jgi:hypothetical protein
VWLEKQRQMNLSVKKKASVHAQQYNNDIKLMV